MNAALTMKMHFFRSALKQERIYANTFSANVGIVDQYHIQIQLAWPASSCWHYVECCQCLQPLNPPAMRHF